MYKKAMLAMVLAASFVTGACSQNDLGRYCFVGAEGGENSNSGSLTILNTEAPECGERLCLKQGGYKCVDGTEPCAATATDQIKIQPMCTKECETNSDCEKSDENVNGCGKFVCQAQGAETGFGDHCICVCLDFLRNDNGSAISVETFNEEDDFNACGGQ